MWRVRDRPRSRPFGSPESSPIVILYRVETLARTDIAIFRWINQGKDSPWLDAVMAFLSGNPYFVPALVLVAILLVWKGGARGIVFVVVMSIAAALANEFVVEPLKDHFQRVRPYAGLTDVILRVGRGTTNASLPSGHAMNAALMATITGWFYPRTLWWVVPVAVGVGVSRIYNGVHYPSDVLAGASLGVASAFLALWGCDRIWRAVTPRWGPEWARRVHSLLRPDLAAAVEHQPGNPVPPEDPQRTDRAAERTDRPTA